MNDVGQRSWWRHRAPLCLLVATLLGTTLAACSSGSTTASETTSTVAAAITGRVLLVGTLDGHPGGYRSIQAAVNAARKGDWILVAPGDYHETDDHARPPSNAAHGDFGGVLISTSDLHLRGMNRNTVIVDGTKPGGSTPCSADPAQQDFGPVGTDGKADGRNGIVVWKADDVSIENLTACNFLGGAGAAGNEIWWNGGADRASSACRGTRVGTSPPPRRTTGAKPPRRSTGSSPPTPRDPGCWDQLYASNFNDSGMYIGACRQVCDATIDHAWMEFSALGYSGTNSGGALVIENSQFDNNKDGVDTNTQIDGDAPAPQNGECPNNETSPITHTHSCWVFIHNSVHDNNNPNVPQAGSASAGPTGTGMTVSGGTNDTVMDNTFSNNGAWGVLFVPYPDSNPPVLGQTCAGAGGAPLTGFGCVLDARGDALLDNTFTNDGYFGNLSNADFGQIVINGGGPPELLLGQHRAIGKLTGRARAEPAHL